MLRSRRVEAAWTALFVAIAVLGLLASEGEPVCEGPFITRVDDSSPPQCPSPVELLPVVGVVWFLGVLAILAVRPLRGLRELRR